MSAVLIAMLAGWAGCGDEDLGSYYPSRVEASWDWIGPDGQPVPGVGLIWPISGSLTADRLSSTFGPRIQISTEEYDFHRGIDIYTEEGTTVRAIYGGEVVIAGSHDSYPDRIVQIRHCADSELPADPEDCESPFFSNYQHLSKVSVSTGERVEQGQGIALSGESSAGFPHLHFEIRWGSSWQQSSVHPLGLLPHVDTGPPTLIVDAIDFADPAAPVAAVTVMRPAAELDLLRVEAAVVTADDDTVLSSQSYDMHQWNYEHTQPGDSSGELDNRFFRGITVTPERFDFQSDVQTVRYRFRRLTSDRPAGKVRIVLRATDVHGQSSEVVCSYKGC